ncbi:MAG: peptidoglycan DD-metalloendopeptidase family protein, partial [Burkholderiaceae bacterium]
MAAGQGSRMRSAQPKVLHTLAGAPLLQHVLATATALQPRNLVVVVGHQGEQVQAYLSQCAPQAQSVWQRPPQGTGHAVQQAVPQLANDGVVLSAGWRTGYGNAIVISHGGGYSTLYAHLYDIDVSTGQQVSGGDVIGLLGSTGWSTGPHLHFEVRLDG